MKRPNSIRVDSSSIQGEGSYLVWKRLTWGERKEVLKQLSELKGNDKFVAFQTEFMLGQILEWNWVDNAGNPIPLPKAQDDLDALYPEESDFLVDLALRSTRGRVSISDADLKN